jgi:choloylglycine hydrolase
MCTSFRVKATDGSVVVGRTMEFPNAMQTKITVLPRGFDGTGIGVDGPGRTWTSTYGVVGMDVFGHADMFTDAMNEKGLYAGLLYMPGFCDYASADGADPSTLMSIVKVIAFLLGTCATVAEARTAMTGITVWPWVLDQFGFAPPAHLAVHDPSGDSVVFEWTDGQLATYDNPIGVMCNWPNLDWHLTNVRNYLNLSVRNPSPITIDGVELSAMGQGAAMHGLPGDSSSPSRFVRAVAFASSLRPVDSAGELEKTALHVLNNFDIPEGFIRDDDAPANDDHTLWSSIANLAERRYTVRTYDNPIPQTVELDRVDFDGATPRQVDLPDGGFATLAV